MPEWYGVYTAIIFELYNSTIVVYFETDVQTRGETFLGDKLL